MSKLGSTFGFISSCKQAFTDRGFLAVTGLLSYFSVTVEELNLYLAVVVKLGTITTTLAYLVLNRRRISVAVVSLFKKNKKRKK